MLMLANVEKDLLNIFFIKNVEICISILIGEGKCQSVLDRVTKVYHKWRTSPGHDKEWLPNFVLALVHVRARIWGFRRVLISFLSYPRDVRHLWSSCLTQWRTTDVLKLSLSNKSINVLLTKNILCILFQWKNEGMWKGRNEKIRVCRKERA